MKSYFYMKLLAWDVLLNFSCDLHVGVWFIRVWDPNNYLCYFVTFVCIPSVFFPKSPIHTTTNPIPFPYCFTQILNSILVSMWFLFCFFSRKRIISNRLFGLLVAMNLNVNTLSFRWITYDLFSELKYLSRLDVIFIQQKVQFRSVVPLSLSVVKQWDSKISTYFLSNKLVI